jgi:hypothetical protein
MTPRVLAIRTLELIGAWQLTVEPSQLRMMKTLVFRLTLCYTCCFCLSLALTSVSYAQRVRFTKNLVAMWLFDEGTGKRVKDSSGNRHHGKFAAGKPTWVDGKFGTALEFRGGDEPDWVEIDIPVAVNTVDFTFGCWMKPGRPQNWHANLFGGRDGGEAEDGGTGFSFAQNEGSLNKFRVRIGGIFNWQGQGDPRHAVKLKTEGWNHIVFVRAGREGIWYRDGEPDRKKKKGFYLDLGSTDRVKPAKRKFRIGNSIWNQDRSYKGIIDEAFIFERALSQDTIQDIINKCIEKTQSIESTDKLATLWGQIKSWRD